MRKRLMFGLLGVALIALAWRYSSRDAALVSNQPAPVANAGSQAPSELADLAAAQDRPAPVNVGAAAAAKRLELPTINPKIAATTQVFRPFAQAQTHAELLSLLESYPAADRTRFKQAVIEPVSQWCASVWSTFFETPEFQRQSPGRYRAIVQLREFCGGAPPAVRTDFNAPIYPLGSALLGFYARAANRSQADVTNLFELGMSVQGRYRSGAAVPPPELGCEYGCAGAFSAASMILACSTVGGCGPRSALALGFCATGFIAEGCRRDADYVMALRDRYPFAEWRRIEWAIGVIGKELNP